MALVSTYDPSSQAQCPKCGLVHCDNIGGITFGYDAHLDFRHEECGTEWRWYIGTGQIESPIPRPQTLREAMGEESWARQKHKERVNSVSFEMLAVLEEMLDVGMVHWDTVKAVVAKANGRNP